jgi:hypothetical protein
MFGQMFPNIWATVAQCSSKRKQNATYIRTQLTVFSQFDSSSLDVEGVGPSDGAIHA